jgi:hypothetical protein
MMSEDQLQSQCFTHHWNSYPNERGLLFMVHNTPRNKIDGARLKAMGMVAGVSDMIYLRRDLPPLCLEFKTESGRQSSAQVEWQKVAEANGCEYRIIRTFDEFKEAIRPTTANT